MPSTQPTILIADDVEIMRELLERYLVSLNCNVIGMAENGAECIEKIKTLTPDIVFLDINMPEKTGFEILDEIRASHTKTFPVIISGNGDFENLKQSMEKGAQGFVVKPFNINKIKEILEKYASAQTQGPH